MLQMAVSEMQNSPNLSDAEIQWLQQFALHLISEFSVLKESDGPVVPLEAAESNEGPL